MKTFSRVTEVSRENRVTRARLPDKWQDNGLVQNSRILLPDNWDISRETRVESLSSLLQSRHRFSSFLTRHGRVTVKLQCSNGVLFTRLCLITLSRCSSSRHADQNFVATDRNEACRTRDLRWPARAELFPKIAFPSPEVPKNFPGFPGSPSASSQEVRWNTVQRFPAPWPYANLHRKSHRSDRQSPQLLVVEQIRRRKFRASDSYLHIRLYACPFLAKTRLIDLVDISLSY